MLSPERSARFLGSLWAGFYAALLGTVVLIASFGYLNRPALLGVQLYGSWIMGESALLPRSLPGVIFGILVLVIEGIVAAFVLEITQRFGGRFTNFLRAAFVVLAISAAMKVVVLPGTGNLGFPLRMPWFPMMLSHLAMAMIIPTYPRIAKRFLKHPRVTVISESPAGISPDVEIVYARGPEEHGKAA